MLPPLNNCPSFVTVKISTVHNCVRDFRVKNRDKIVDQAAAARDFNHNEDIFITCS